jgi:hypothetical protein
VKHLAQMTAEELSRVVCLGYEGHPCTNTMDEYGCRNNMKDNEALCAECCADTLEDSGIECCG